MEEEQFVLSPWRRNRGTMLVAAAAAISLLTCGLWYFDVLPRIELVPPTAIDVGLRLEKPTPRPNTLVLTMVAPTELPESPINGIVEIHPSFGDLSVSEPLLSEGFVLSEGSVVSLAINQLISGDYALLVYLDENANGRLDFDEHGLPLEICRTANSPDRRPQSFQNELAVLQLKPGLPLYITFFFED